MSNDIQKDPSAFIADPGPLGLAAFALTTFMLSTFNAGVLAVDLEHVVLPVALFYGGIAQLLAGMWEFKKNNTFGALAFTSYGAFWLSFAGYVQFVAHGLPAETAHNATGLFLLAWTIFTFYMLIGSNKTNTSLFLTFLVLEVTFVALTLGAFTGTTMFTRIGGWLGLLTAFLAWYTSAAGVLNPMYGKALLPVGPRKVEI